MRVQLNRCGPEVIGVLECAMQRHAMSSDMAVHRNIGRAVRGVRGERMLSTAISIARNAAATPEARVVASGVVFSQARPRMFVPLSFTDIEELALEAANFLWCQHPLGGDLSQLAREPSQGNAAERAAAALDAVASDAGAPSKLRSLAVEPRPLSPGLRGAITTCG